MGHKERIKIASGINADEKVLFNDEKLDVTTMDPWQYMKSGEYARAVVAYTQRIKEQGSLHYLPNLNNRAMGYLNLGDYGNALADFNEAERAYLEEPYLKKNNHRTDAYRQMVGVTLWLMGREAEAQETWAELLKDHERGLITYTDAAGGIETPCLAWFAGTALANRPLVHAAEALLDQRFQAQEAINWPGPLAPFILGRISEKDLLRAAGKSVPLKHRHACQANFYIGARSKLAGDTQKTVRIYRTVSRTNALLEAEYYLAAREYEKSLGVRERSPKRWWQFWT